MLARKKDGTLTESKKFRHVLNCAKAMDLFPTKKEHQETWLRDFGTEWETYNPYVSYSECLKLVERYYLTLSRYRDKWMCHPSTNAFHFKFDDLIIINKDIKTAIVECASILYEKIEEQKRLKSEAKKLK